MPSYLLDVSLWAATWPIPLLALVVGGLLSAVVARTRWERRSWAVALFAFSLLGSVTGVLAGFSRQPVIGAVLPAVLSLVGALALYLVGQDSGNRALVSCAVIALSITLWIGANWGARMRDDSEQFKASAAFLKRQAVIELEVREFREALGLPATPGPLSKPQTKEEVP